MISILLQQMAIMVILAGVGFCMFRLGKISLEGSRTMGNILLYLSLPCVIINGFLVERTQERIEALLISMLAAAVVLGLSVWISRMFFKKDPIAGFAGAFSNPGFFGVPLIAASLSDGAVFYIAAFIAFLNILQWTYGVFLLTGEKARVRPQKLFSAPFFVASAVGLFFFLTRISPPELLAKSLQLIANLNTPLAMFGIGVYMAGVNWKGMVRKSRLYTISAVRLVVIPVVSLAVLSLLPADFHELKAAVLIAAACPVGSNIAVYAQLYQKDYPYAVEAVVISTVLSVVTIPTLLWISELLWRGAAGSFGIAF